MVGVRERIMATDTLQRGLKILVSDDRLRATLRLSADEDYSAVGSTDIIKALEQAKIAVNDDVRARVSELAARLKKGEPLPEEMDLAVGVLPGTSVDASFEFVAAAPGADAGSDDDDDGDEGPGDASMKAISFREQCRFFMIEQGGVLGTYTAPSPGNPGIDVFGKAIPPACKPKTIDLADNVRLDDDGTTVRATVDGKVHYVNRRLSVQPVVEIKGNVDFESGSVEARTDVLVRGDVLDGFHVTSAKNVSVGGFIEAAQVQADGDVQVRGGISGKNKGEVRAKGQIVAKFCNEANLRAEGDIHVAKEVLNSTVHTRGFLHIPRGSLIGGTTYARCGGDVRTVGSEANIRTEVTIGIDPAAFGRCAEIDQQVEKHRRAAQKIRDTVAPLLAQLKRLAPSQRERATELMYEADRIEGDVQAMLERRETILREASPEEMPALRVQSRIFPGVVIGIGDRVTLFSKELKGPVKITRRKVERVEEIVAVNELTAGVTVLPSRDIELNYT